MNRYQKAESIEVHKFLKRHIPELRLQLENYGILNLTDSDISHKFYKQLRRHLNKQYIQYKKEKLNNEKISCK